SARNTLGTNPDFSAIFSIRTRRSSGSSVGSTAPNRLTEASAVSGALMARTYRGRRDPARQRMREPVIGWSIASYARSGDHGRVPLPKEYQGLFSRWCADRVPGHARASLQVGYSIRGDLVTIVRRKPPRFPELNSAWTSTPIAQLRHNDPEQGMW